MIAVPEAEPPDVDIAPVAPFAVTDWKMLPSEALEVSLRSPRRPERAVGVGSRTWGLRREGECEGEPKRDHAGLSANYATRPRGASLTSNGRGITSRRWTCRATGTPLTGSSIATSTKA